MFSILEQHNDGSWWYHIGKTYDTRDEAETKGHELFGGGSFLKPRPYKVIEHTKPFPQDMARCSFDCVHFNLAGGWNFSLEDEEDKPLKEQPEVDLGRDAVSFCYDNGINISPRCATAIARHFYELGLNARKEEGKV